MGSCGYALLQEPQMLLCTWWLFDLLMIYVYCLRQQVSQKHVFMWLLHKGDHTIAADQLSNDLCKNTIWNESLIQIWLGHKKHVLILVPMPYSYNVLWKNTWHIVCLQWYRAIKQTILACLISMKWYHSEENKLITCPKKTWDRLSWRTKPTRQSSFVCLL